MDSGSPVGLGRGATGWLSVGAIVVVAAALVAGVVIWPQPDDGSAAATAAAARAEKVGTLSSGRRIAVIRGWPSADGQTVVPSNDDVCGLVGAVELRKITADPNQFESPAVLAGKDNWGGRCEYFSDEAGRRLATTITFNPRPVADLSTLLVPRVTKELVGDPGVCDEEIQPKTRCARLVAVPGIGRRAEASVVWVTDKGEPFWAFDKLVFEQSGFVVQINLAITRHDHSARVVRLAQTIANRLPNEGNPVQTVVRPPECTDEASC